MAEQIAADAGKEMPPNLPPAEYPSFLQQCRDAMQDDAYTASLASILSPNGKEPYRPIHRAMIQTAFASYVTSNYDASLENADALVPKMLPAGSVLSYPDDQLDPTQLRSRFLLHVHGRAYDGDTCLLPSIVVTDADFADAYRRPDVMTTLGSLLSGLCVVFVGFSADDGILQRVIKEYVGPYQENILQAPHPPKNPGGEVRYYVLRDVCLRRWRVSVDKGKETTPIEVTAVDPQEWQSAHDDARTWFRHPPFELGQRVRPILYARRQDDILHERLTALMNELQQTPGCATAVPGGLP